MARSRVKDEELYEKLREEQDYSKEKAARIANAAAKEGRSAQGKKGGGSPQYEDWTVDQLKTRAKELELTGYSALNKSELIDLLRNH
ncbi:DUF7218 family protein [Nesterenkonia muleiensis]|uniref:DUF7218 family protein n=1 Tax=Nesterenkonia muleiensis TaxID=2282648 RepID=UPI000E7478D0|nr:Rho termination factor N-terminal domain-containing protein [Nesterenkonia muleiensis]